MSRVLQGHLHLVFHCINRSLSVCICVCVCLCWRYDLMPKLPQRCQHVQCASVTRNFSMFPTPHHNILTQSFYHVYTSACSWLRGRGGGAAGQVGTAAVGVPYPCPRPPPPSQAGQSDRATGGCPVAPVPAGGRAVGHHPQVLLPLFTAGMQSALHASPSFILAL